MLVRHNDTCNTLLASGCWLGSFLLYRLRGLCQPRLSNPMGDTFGIAFRTSSKPLPSTPGEAVCRHGTCDMTMPIIHERKSIETQHNYHLFSNKACISGKRIFNSENGLNLPILSRMTRRLRSWRNSGLEERRASILI